MNKKKKKYYVRLDISEILFQNKCVFYKINFICIKYIKNSLNAKQNIKKNSIKKRHVKPVA